LRQYFPDTLLWEGALVTDENGEITIPFRNAHSLTRWRVEVRAVHEEHFGETVVHFRTASPFALRASLPPFLFRGDRLSAEVTLWNALDPQSVQLDLLTSPGLTGNLDMRETMVGREEKLVFPLHLEAREPGDAWFRLYARGETATDGIELPLPVLETAIRVHSERSVLFRDESAGFDFLYEPEAYTKAPEVNLILFANRNERLLREGKSIYRYPYRGSEQIASQIIALLSLPSVSTNNWTEQIPSVIREGIHELYSLQNHDGGWGWWSNGDSMVFHTAHVLLAFSLAREHGYPVGHSTLERARHYLGWAVGEADPFEHLLADYALARLFKEETEFGRVPVWVVSELDDKALALFLLLSPEPERAFLTETLLNRRNVYGDTMFFGEHDPEKPWIDDRILSTTLAAKALFESGAPLDANRAYLWLWRALEGDRYLDTIDQAYFLLVSRLFGEEESTSDAPTFQVTVNGQSIPAGTGVFGPELSPVISVPSDLLTPGVNRIEVSGHTLFMATLDVIGFMEEPPDEGLLSVQRRYWKLRTARREDGNLIFVREPIETLLPGDEILCELVIDSPYPLENLVIEEGMPAGFELVRTWFHFPLSDDLDGEDYAYYQIVTLHNHQPVIFVHTLKKGENVIRYLLRARDTGVFSVLPGKAYLMYHPEVYGYSEVANVEIGR
ncbi:MAG TPA: alpha-2-macroglobulin family protein, partial [Atribacteraceae bacterium]|nr:alpha-2-macroglobulin family protein [Atribacteraceae bacterium]